jgi:hypothetical protein
MEFQTSQVGVGSGVAVASRSSDYKSLGEQYYQ